MMKTQVSFNAIFRNKRLGKLLLLLTFSLFINFISTSSAYAQSKKVIRELRKMRKTKDKTIYLYKSIEDLEGRESQRVALFGLQQNDTIASIGAAWGRLEVAYGCLVDNMVFYLEDIDSTRLNNLEMKFNLDYYRKLSGKPNNTQYHIQLGTEKRTNLPVDFFNKVLIVNSFHEFSHKSEMLHDFHDILKMDGVLILDELVATYSGETHPGCGNRIYTEAEIVEMISKEGFYFTGSNWDMKPGKHYAGTKVYIFRKQDYLSGNRVN